MRRFTRYFGFLLLLFAGITGAFAQTVNPNNVDGEVYFQLKPYTPVISGGEKGVVAVNQVAFLDAIKDTYQISKVERPFYMANNAKLQRTYLIHFKDIYGVDSLISILKKDSVVAYAEKAPLFRIFYTPNDPYFNSSLSFDWYLKVIKAESAWDIQKGSSKIKIAIVDNAIDVTHPDLRSKIVDQIDLADGDSNASPPKQTVDWSHGTHTSGLAGAQTDNGVGIASIGFNVSLLAVKISSDTTDGSTMRFGYQGIVWAADHGANVLSLSWGGPGYYQTGQDVINYAYNKGCVIVAAAGNDGNSTVSYPAGYNHVIAVAATNDDDSKASFSQYGSFVDVCAPGGSYNGYGIYSTVDLSTTQYDYMEGTSMATPIVSGLCGLMLSEDSLVTPEKLEAILKKTCDNIDIKNPDYIGELGAGRINAYKALLAVQDTLANQTIVANFEASSVSVPEGGEVNFTDKSSGNATSWKWTFEGGSPSTSTQQNPSNILYSSPGSYNVTLTISDGTNSNTETKTNYIVVYPLVSGAWLPQATGFSAQYRAIDHICIVSPDTVWADAIDGSGNGANVLEFTKTKDGGNNWTPGAYNGVPTSCTVSNIWAVNASHAWIATYRSSSSAPITDQGIYVTTNGGASWTKQSTALFNNSTYSFPDGVYFWNNNDGICFGDPVFGYFEIYTTTNGGNSWIRVPNANIPTSVSGEYGYTDLFDVYGDSTFWFGTNKGNVYKSTDRGQHWTESSTGLPEVSGLGFHNDSVGIASYVSYGTSGSVSNFAMAKTKDGGATWVRINPTGNYYKGDIAVVPNAEKMLVAIQNDSALLENGSAYSLDEGDTWTQLDDSVQYTTVKFYSSSVGWAGGFNENSTSRGIWKWLGIPTGVTELPVNGMKIKVYPNPSAGVVHFYVPKNESVTRISIYDLNGKLVSHLENSTGNSEQDYVMNLRNLTAGVYVAVVKTKRGVSKFKLVLQ